MIELIVTACMTLAPGTCRDHRIPIADEISVFQCMMPPVIPTVTKWASEHPEWDVKKWTCRAYRPEKDI